MRHYKFLLALVVLGFFSLSGCRTITVGRTQDVDFSSSLAGVTIEVVGIGTYQMPAVVSLARDGAPYTVRFSKEGYDTFEMRIEKNYAFFPHLIGNILFGGVLGMVIDFGSGSAYDLAPKDVQISLERAGIDTADFGMDMGEEYFVIAVSDLDSTPLEMIENTTGARELHRIAIP